MSSFKKNKKASKYADCKNSGKESLLKYYGVKTERRVRYEEGESICTVTQLEGREPEAEQAQTEEETSEEEGFPFSEREDFSFRG